MPIFAYRAVRASGEMLSGELEAASRAEAYRLLDRQKLQPVSLVSGEEAEAAARPAASSGTAGEPIPLTKAQVILFSEELSDLLDAGLQLEAALRVIEQRQESSAIKRVAARLRAFVREGTGFAAALRASSPSFGELFCNLMAAGEASGSLSTILRRQIQYLNAIGELRNRIIQALIYPMFIVGSGLVLMMVFLTFLVPQLTVLFTRSETDVPFATMVLIESSRFIREYWWVLLALVVVGGLAFRYYIRTAAGRLWWHRFIIRVPLFGPVLAARFYAQLSYTLANLVGNGIPLLAGLSLVERATGNVYLRGRMKKVMEDVSEGRSLSRSMISARGFPSLMVDLVSVGEQTGNLASSLEKIAVRYEKDMTRRIARITALIQPTVILIIALVVGTVVVSIVTSIFQAVSGLRV